jgi:Fe-S-cluster-containing dehydrogenase component/formate-dependent nitrite reductase membrane component NrfD
MAHGATEATGTAESSERIRWAKVVDHESCIGCHACTTACKSENEVPLSVTRTYVKYVDVGTFPRAHRAFQVTRCNQCEHAPCVTACPTAAMYSRADGIVDFDKSICIGCKACIAACPYDAIFINPEDHSAEKCNFCAHRIDVGLEPACVVVCPTEALMVGNLDDPTSRVSKIVHREPVAVRRPEKETRPKVFYRGARQSTLDPLAAARPTGGLFMWSQQTEGVDRVVSGHPEPPNNSAAAILAYDVPHRIPWDWKVSLYTLTKGVAAGVYLVAAFLQLSSGPPTTSPLWLTTTPLVALLALGLTGLLLIADLEHPRRFYLLFLRPQWKSWLVRGAFIITLFGLALLLHGALGLLGIPPPGWLVVVGVLSAVLTAVYTAYLFAQAKARDLWQSALLPPHLLVQAWIAGLATFYLMGGGDPGVALHLNAAVLVHLLLVLGELTVTHTTAHSRLALREMTHGRFRGFFRASVGLMIGAALAPALAAAWPLLGYVSALSALAGLACYEHAHVQAAQSVPLA